MKNIRIKMIILCFLADLAAPILFPGALAAGEIRVSMAASMKDAVTEIFDAFEKAHPDATIQKNSGGSGAIAKQIEAGAPADIFLSANLEWMDYLTEKGIIDKASVSVLAYNTLVFIGRPGLDIKGLKDLVMLERIAIGSPKSVPAGEYAVAALQKAGLMEKLEGKLVMAKDVRECLMYAERGEVDGAFIYKTDTLDMTGKLTIIIEVPQDLYPRVTYPMGLTDTGAKNPDAKAFLQFLKSGEAKAVFLKYGFIIEE